MTDQIADAISICSMASFFSSVGFLVGWKCAMKQAVDNVQEACDKGIIRMIYGPNWPNGRAAK